MRNLTATPLAFGLSAALACAMLGASASAFAQQAFGRVLSATPIYESVAQPQETCTERYQTTRCQTSTSYEDQIVGYNVLYEYMGQKYTQRMAQKPGSSIPIQTTPLSESYSSNSAPSSNAVIPGQNSYSSSPAGASSTDSIQYYQNDNNLPAQIDLHLGQPPRNR